LDHDNLPIYTILVPVYHEASVLPQVVAGIGKLDYPADRLDVKILLEADDIETIQAAQALNLPDTFEICRVPDVGPRGKPRACNYGLNRAKGKYLVIFDAEDQPEPDQLLKAVWAFENSDPSVICLQAKLNYFNRDQNLLTRWFTAEYSTWFDLLLPGLYSLNVAIPLGGTSNHFDTERLRELGAWDAYNVTEDADLGIRLYTAGYTTAVIDSTTYEEANSRPYNWIRQRSRWVKGYLQTYLVHMRRPIRLYRQLGPRAFLVFQLFVGGNVLTLLLNPIYWVLTILWFSIHLHLIQVVFPGPLMYIGMVGLLVGNFVFTFAAMAGCVRRRNYADVKYAALTPIYWTMMSIAAWKGFLQLFYRPFYWEKTVHGLDSGVEQVGG
jgi:cellulose synthase/poly-beta-1,6-N-acetylglucosamine synthase-like glycosyltransferase